jgi:voltage-gated sodium channel
MTAWASHLIHTASFQRGIIAMILLAGALAGLETNAGIVARHETLFQALDLMVLAVFITEAVLKLAAQRWRYFSDGWNVFDFIIVAVCCLPIDSQFAVVLRLTRLLRLLRLVTALPKLQLLVGALLKSLGAMGYVGLLLGLMFYVYAVAGIHLFGSHDPKHFGTMPAALLTLFQMITLDDWGNIFADARGSAPITTGTFFVSFIMLGTMIMLNLFIGVITSSMAEMHAEMDEKDRVELHQAGLHQVAAMEEQLRSLRAWLQSQERSRSHGNPAGLAPAGPDAPRSLAA